jgi:hypothetical protein
VGSTTPSATLILRDLEAVGIGWDQGWANDLAGLLVEAKHTVEEARTAGTCQLVAAMLHSIRVRDGQLVAKGFVANPAPDGRRSTYWSVSTVNAPTCCGSSPISPCRSTTRPIGTSAQ